MTAGLHRARLVHVDVAGVGADRALMRTQRRRDHHHVHLRAADEEMHISLRRVTGLTDQLGSMSAVRILAVAGRLLHVRPGKRLENGRMAAFVVIAVKANHF